MVDEGILAREGEQGLLIHVALHSHRRLRGQKIKMTITVDQDGIGAQRHCADEQIGGRDRDARTSSLETHLGRLIPMGVIGRQVMKG